MRLYANFQNGLSSIDWFESDCCRNSICQYTNYWWIKKLIAVAAKNIRTFHASQKRQRTGKKRCLAWRGGVKMLRLKTWFTFQRNGSFVFYDFDVIILLKIAGCKRLVLCTPHRQKRKGTSSVLYTTSSLESENLQEVGGAQAVCWLFLERKRCQSEQIFGPEINLWQPKSWCNKAASRWTYRRDPTVIIADENADASFVASGALKPNTDR
jgi:histidinol dehydrogenase